MNAQDWSPKRSRLRQEFSTSSFELLWNLTARAYRCGDYQQLRPWETSWATTVSGLGWQDLIFIYGETSNSKMHVAGLLPFTPPD